MTPSNEMLSDVSPPGVFLTLACSLSSTSIDYLCNVNDDDDSLETVNAAFNAYYP